MYVCVCVCMYKLHISQARVFCLMALVFGHIRMTARGRSAPEGKCVYIRQGMRAWDITNMLHFLHSALLNLPCQTKHLLCLYSWGCYL